MKYSFIFTLHREKIQDEIEFLDEKKLTLLVLIDYCIENLIPAKIQKKYLDYMDFKRLYKYCIDYYFEFIKIHGQKNMKKIFNLKNIKNIIQLNYEKSKIEEFQIKINNRNLIEYYIIHILSELCWNENIRKNFIAYKTKLFTYDKRTLKKFKKEFDTCIICFEEKDTYLCKSSLNKHQIGCSSCMSKIIVCSLCNSAF
jgi:hypothetical protein